jgi:hypothetical protein
LVVGGYAVMKYTEPRYTKDLDLWVEASSENAPAVFQALREFGAPLTNITSEDFSKTGSVYQMGRPPARIDILTSIEGVRFDEAWTRRVRTDLGGIEVNVISCEDLLTNKRALGRPQDLLDVTNLQSSLEALKERPAEVAGRRVGKSKRRKRKDR